MTTSLLSITSNLECSMARELPPAPEPVLLPAPNTERTPECVLSIS